MSDHPQNPIYIGTAGWSIPKIFAQEFPAESSYLERYAARFTCVEINTSFYKLHMRKTYERWAATTPPHFRFSAKIPKQITHTARLRDCSQLDEFLEGVTGLGEKLGSLLVQLPPSLAYDAGRAAAFFARLVDAFRGDIVLEPRHPSWFAPSVEALLHDLHIARAAADPPRSPQGIVPGGWDGLAYYRLHGSPQMYISSYSQEYLDGLARSLEQQAQERPVWCIFDNTTEGAAVDNALSLKQRLGA